MEEVEYLNYDHDSQELQADNIYFEVNHEIDLDVDSNVLQTDDSHFEEDNETVEDPNVFQPNLPDSEIDITLKPRTSATPIRKAKIGVSEIKQKRSKELWAGKRKLNGPIDESILRRNETHKIRLDLLKKELEKSEGEIEIQNAKLEILKLEKEIRQIQKKYELAKLKRFEEATS